MKRTKGQRWRTADPHPGPDARAHPGSDAAAHPSTTANTTACPHATARPSTDSSATTRHAPGRDPEPTADDHVKRR